MYLQENKSTLKIRHKNKTASNMHILSQEIYYLLKIKVAQG